MNAIIAAGFGGFVGASLRFMMVNLIGKHFPSNFIPLGTLGVNVIGSFIIGLLLAFFQSPEINIHPHLKAFLITGTLGGFTTFSTFSFETLNLFQNGNHTYAFLNIFLQVFLSIIFCFLGVLTAKTFS